MPRQGIDSWKMTLLKFTGVTVTCIAIVIGCYFSYIKIFPKCHSAFENARRYMSTKSPYHVDLDAGPGSILTDCTAHQIWLLIRHGTRNPSADVITDMKTNLPLLRDDIIKNHHLGQLCENEISSLKSWGGYPDLKESNEKMLVEQGANELHDIAKRYKQRFPQLFTSQYTNSSFKFKYTKTQRTEESAIAFSKGLFGDDHQNVWYPEALQADPILRFYKDCPKWKQEVNKNPEAYKEKKLFEGSHQFQHALERVTERLGLENQLSKEQLVIMYLGCSFETAWNPTTLSPWCAVFSEEDFRVIEYFEDLDYYWIDGYGYEITYKVACPAINDIIMNFENRMKGHSDAPNVISYFTHSGTNLKLLARLGLFNDSEPLRSDNFHSQAGRKWRTSHIDTFASNLGVVLYKCSNDEYKVGVLFQEKEIQLPFCDQIHCSFDEFRKQFSQVIQECDKEEMCRFH